MKKTILLMVIVFVTGWFFNSVYSAMFENNMDNVPEINESPYDVANKTVSDTISDTVSVFFGSPSERISPFDHIKEDQIHVFQDRIIIDLENAEWARFTDTNSMDPVIDAGAHAIEIRPSSPDQIHIGDIMSYRSKYAEGIIIHRVVEIGEDEDGWFAKMKGDNNNLMDPGKIRFEQVERLVVAVIY